VYSNIVTARLLKEWLVLVVAVWEDDNEWGMILEAILANTTQMISNTV
jgi:hypothetical protein